MSLVTINISELIKFVTSTFGRDKSNTSAIGNRRKMYFIGVYSTLKYISVSREASLMRYDKWDKETEREVGDLVDRAGIAYNGNDYEVMNDKLKSELISFARYLMLVKFDEEMVLVEYPQIKELINLDFTYDSNVEIKRKELESKGIKSTDDIKRALFIEYFGKRDNILVTFKDGTREKCSMERIARRLEKRKISTSNKPIENLIKAFGDVSMEYDIWRLEIDNNGVHVVKCGSRPYFSIKTGKHNVQLSRLYGNGSTFEPKIRVVEDGTSEFEKYLNHFIEQHFKEYIDKSETIHEVLIRMFDDSDLHSLMTNEGEMSKVIRAILREL